VENGVTGLACYFFVGYPNSSLVERAGREMFYHFNYIYHFHHFKETLFLTFAIPSLPPLEGAVKFSDDSEPNRLEKPNLHNRMQAKRSLRKQRITHRPVKAEHNNGRKFCLYRQFQCFALPQAALRLHAVMKIKPFQC
jgi:hypothetical protein